MFTRISRLMPAVALASMAILGASRAQAQDAVVKLHYTFDDVANPLKDTSGNGNDGTAWDLGMGGAPTADPALIRYGTGAYWLPAIQLPSTFGMDFPDKAFSISMWVKFVDRDTGATITPVDIQAMTANSPGGWAQTGFRWYVNSWQTSDGGVIFETGGPNGAQGMGADTFPFDGNYHNIIVTADFNAHTARTYIDGQDKYDLANMIDFPVNGPITVGAFTDGGAATKALLDDFAIFDGKLTDAQVAAIQTAAVVDPAAPSYVKGDMNGDGSFNNFDITPFVLALTDTTTYNTQYPSMTSIYTQVGDMNSDGSFNNFDITPFVTALTTPHAAVAAVPEPASIGLLGAVALLGLRRRK